MKLRHSEKVGELCFTKHADMTLDANIHVYLFKEMSVGHVP